MERIPAASGLEQRILSGAFPRQRNRQHALRLGPHGGYPGEVHCLATRGDVSGDADEGEEDRRSAKTARTENVGPSNTHVIITVEKTAMDDASLSA